MSEAFATFGQQINLYAQLSDGEESLPIVVKTHIKAPTGNVIEVVKLTHTGGGLFIGSTTMPNFPVICAQHIAYENDGITKADYNLGLQVFSQRGGLDPQDIWEYANRTLTEEVQIDTSEVMGEIKQELDTVVERLENYTCMMTSVLNNTTGVQTLICYLNKNGQTIASVHNARVAIYDDADALLWTGYKDLPDLRGVFKITKNEAEPLLSRDKVYYVKVTISHNNKDYTTNQTFFTVG